MIGLGQTITLEGFQTLIHNALSIECSRLLEQSAEQACNMEDGNLNEVSLKSCLPYTKHFQLDPRVWCEIVLQVSATIYLTVQQLDHD